MAPQANVSSIENIKEFRRQLADYGRKSGAILDEIHEEVMRTRQWLEEIQRGHWKREVKRCERVLDHAQSAMLNARMSKMRNSTMTEQLAVNRAKAQLDAANAKLAKVRRWCQLYDTRVTFLEKGLAGFRNWLDADQPKAMNSLALSIEMLEAYEQTGDRTGQNG